MNRPQEVERASAPQRFKLYPTYKDSGVEWLEEIPAHWAVRKWRYCCRVTEGQVEPDDDRFRDRILIAPNHIESGTGRILYTETAEEQGAISGKYLVKPGDIIYSKIRPALNKVCIAGGDWLCSADMYPVAVTDKDLDPRYLLYFILSEPFVRPMIDESMRVAMPKVNREKLATCPLPIPDLDEQCAITTFLDPETARIDALVAKKERLIELLQEKRTALITRAVTKGLNPNVPMKDSGVEWLGEIPARWEVKPFAKYVVEKSDYRGRTPEKVPSGVLLVTARNVRMGFIDYECSQEFVAADDYREIMRRGLPKRGDILFTTEAPLGNVALVDREEVALAQRIIRFRMNAKHFDNRFTLFAMMSDYFRAQLQTLSTGSTAEGLKASKLSMLYLVAPPPAEQSPIAVFLDQETAGIDALIAKVREAIDRLKELRTALISAAVTGKIDVREVGE